MPRVPVEEAAAGMILSEGVSDRHGRLLVPEGAEINEKHLRGFKIWGVTHIHIQGEEDESVDVNWENLDPKVKKLAEEKAKPLFQHIDMKHPMIAPLYNECILRLARTSLKESD